MFYARRSIRLSIKFINHYHQLRVFLCLFGAKKVLLTNRLKLRNFCHFHYVLRNLSGKHQCSSFVSSHYVKL